MRERDCTKTNRSRSDFMAIRVSLDRVLLQRGITLTDLAERVGMTLANLSILKTNKARAVRFSTLDALCRELDCQPGDLLERVSKECEEPLTEEFEEADL